MNHKTLIRLMVGLAILSLLLAACGAFQPTLIPTLIPPTESPAPIDTAQPAPTLIPPTNTPASTDTPPPAATPRSNSDLPLDNLAFSLPGMDEVIVTHLDYPSADGSPLPMDVYSPPDSEGLVPLPVVIFVMGYADSAPSRAEPLKEQNNYVSWGRLVAASGLIAVTYQTEQADDLEAVAAWIQENGHIHHMDPNRIGLWSCEASSLTAVSFAMQEGRDFLKFAVFYYGQMLTPDNEFRDGINDMCARSGCYSAELKDVTRLRTDLPLLIVRAGREPMRYVNDSIDHFVDVALVSDVNLTLIEFEEGKRYFEEFQRHNPRSAEIIEQTLEFMRTQFQ
jgi:acetyl esterase/lipase